MKFLKTKKFQTIWGVWTLLLGLSLIFFYTLKNVHSSSEYINAFLTLDMPNSWCPTFLTLYGSSTILSFYLGNFFKYISWFAGLVLLPIGLYVTYEFTFQNTSDPLPIYIYAQTIHITEILTGLITLFIFTKKK